MSDLSRAVFLTAYNRPHYMAQTLNSWSHVRGLDDWTVVMRIEPSSHQDEIIRQVRWFEDAAQVPVTVIVNPQCYGVLHHPWVGFEELFSEVDFVVRAEDDLLVSTDILEFFDWASGEFVENKDVAAVIGYTDAGGADDEVAVAPGFGPWIWGTWADRWAEYLRDTWDHDYSTFNGYPGNQAGWDWNLNTRVLPSLGKSCASPLSSRVQNIGVRGVHGTEGNFHQTTSFRREREPVQFHVI